MGLSHDWQDQQGGKPLDLTEAIEEFYRDFPDRKADTFICNYQKHKTWDEAYKTFEGLLTAATKKLPSAKVGLSKAVAQGAFGAKMPCSVGFDDGHKITPKTKIYARVVIPAGPEWTARKLKGLFVGAPDGDLADFPVLPKELNNTEMWQRLVLDHELGHAVTMLAIDKPKIQDKDLSNFLECTADAYALMRHFQRYGSDSKFAEFYVALRNISTVNKAETGHHTCAALEAVMELNKQGKIQGLSPEECKNLSFKIAAEVSMSPDAQHNFEQAFKMQRKIKKTEHEMRLEHVSIAGMKTASPVVFQAVKRYLSDIAKLMPAGLISDATKEAVLGHDLAQMERRNVPHTEPAQPAWKKALMEIMVNGQSGLKDGKPIERPANRNQKSRRPKRRWGR